MLTRNEFKQNVGKQTLGMIWSAPAIPVLLAVLLASGLVYAGPGDGPVLHMSFNSASDPGHDDSGNANHGIVNGAISVAGMVGNALSFPGYGGAVVVPDSRELDLTSSFTIAFWICPESSDEGMVMSKHVAWTDGDGSWIVLRTDESHPYYPGRLLMHNWLSPTRNEVHSQRAVPQSMWTHWAISYDASTHLCTFYRDGEVDTIYTQIFDIRNTTLDLTIGAGEHRDIPLAYWFKGLMDEVRIYNRALSASEVGQLATDVIEAQVDVDPDVLNLQGAGKWITAYVTLPPGYDVSEVDPTTILLEESIVPSWCDIDETEQILKVKFDRAEVQWHLVPGDIEFLLTGLLRDGTLFEGTHTVHVIE